jgi:hypothetical protein
VVVAVAEVVILMLVAVPVVPESFSLPILHKIAK